MLLRVAVLLLAAGACYGGVIEMESWEMDSSEWGLKSIKGSKSTNCSCGLSYKPSSRIIGGKETGINEYPLMVGLMYRSSKIVVCGGSIITPYHVLTAAHCTTPMKEANREMAVVVGEHDLYRIGETDATKIINVERSIEHENYGKLAHPNDIALLVLEEKIEFNDRVGPVCLPNKMVNLEGQYVRVIGWGRTSPEGSGSSVLLKVDLRVVPTDECNKHLPIKLPVNIPRQFCTYARKKDSCKGDSGGPLIWLDPETNRYTQVGLVSFGFGCAGSLNKKILTLGVNTNVAYYVDWIQKNIRESKPEGRTCSKV